MAGTLWVQGDVYVQGTLAGVGIIGLTAREIVGDLRAVTSDSLSRDELRYRVGEPSLPLWMDLGEDEMGRSLGEAIETTEMETFFT